MKTRCFDHIDLRVKDMDCGKKVLRKIFAAAWICSGKTRAKNIIRFILPAANKPSEFFGFNEDKNHKPNRHTHRVLGGYARRSGSACEVGARGGRQDA